MEIIQERKTYPSEKFPGQPESLDTVSDFTEVKCHCSRNFLQFSGTKSECFRGFIPEAETMSRVLLVPEFLL